MQINQEFTINRHDFKYKLKLTDLNLQIQAINQLSKKTYSNIIDVNEILVFPADSKNPFLTIKLTNQLIYQIIIKPDNFNYAEFITDNPDIISIILYFPIIQQSFTIKLTKN